MSLGFNLQEGAEGGIDSTGSRSLEPGIYKKCKLLEIKQDSFEGKDGGIINILKWSWKTAEDLIHDHSEFEPKPEAHTPKAEGKKPAVHWVMKRILHITKRYNEEAVTAVQEGKVPEFSTWDALCEWVIKFTNKNTPENIEVDLKIVGNVYDGKARTGFPNFPTFIRLSGGPTSEQLTFTNNDLQANQEYKEFKDGSTTDSSVALPVGMSTNGEDAPVPTEENPNISSVKEGEDIPPDWV